MSSAIEAVDYEPVGQQLTVELTNGHAYRYLDVPQSTYEAFKAAESKGRFYNDHIRDAFLYDRLC